MGQSKPYRPTALVVEDDPIQREMISFLLAETDYDVIQCEDAETAELALKSRHPAVLITDVSLVGNMRASSLRIWRGNPIRSFALSSCPESRCRLRCRTTSRSFRSRFIRLS